MNTKLIAAGALSGLVIAAGTAGMVSAQSAASATTLPEEQIIAIALAEVPGEVTEVELERDDGVLAYEVELIAADGTEMEVMINAETGEIIEVEAEDDRDGCDKDDEDDDDGEDA